MSGTTVAQRAEHRAWFERTEHCGQCGNPGTYCTCTAVCGCADLHEMGSAFTAGALDGFADAAPVDQPELF